MTLEALLSNDLPNFSTTPNLSYSNPTFSFGGGGNDDGIMVEATKPPCAFLRKKRRRRTRIGKNKEEVESQRMSHIAVERNRRRQMNEHLAVLRSLMPESYVQRGDQASIVGGAINYVKELEQLLQSLEAQKIKLQKHKENVPTSNEDEGVVPLVRFFGRSKHNSCHHFPRNKSPEKHGIATAVADIEVALVEAHLSVKVLCTRWPRQLMRMVAGFESVRLCILHVNVSSLDHIVLYSISAKVEEGCNLRTVDDIAAAVHHMLSLIEAEHNSSASVNVSF